MARLCGARLQRTKISTHTIMCLVNTTKYPFHYRERNTSELWIVKGEICKKLRLLKADHKFNVYKSVSSGKGELGEKPLEQCPQKRLSRMTSSSGIMKKIKVIELDDFVRWSNSPKKSVSIDRTNTSSWEKMQTTKLLNRAQWQGDHMKYHWKVRL